MTNYEHIPVLLKRVIEYLSPKSGGIYFDGTLGGGGYAEAILEASAPDGVVVGVDVDEDAIAAARERLSKFGARARIEKASYGDVAQVADHPRKNACPPVVWRGDLENAIVCRGSPLTTAGMTNFRGNDRIFDGMVLDLGISSHQVDEASRGFSFSKDAPLDMRMDRDSPRTAADVVNGFSEAELKELFERYGEEKFAGRIARAIVAERRTAPITRTLQLEKICYASYPAALRRGRIHPATRTFQALRIEVNGELKNLEAFLDKAPHVLKENGRIVIVSYHSLEDRMVKTKFRELAKGCSCPRQRQAGIHRAGYWPDKSGNYNKGGGFRILTKKPVEPSEDEVQNNPRARSAKLRAIELSF